ncbi:MAG: complex I NDUFA9 subunit family protein [Nitrospirae bacterium]|nr:complex I NDUFA9 subunit family protein [Nitrospirota bacterium]
MKVFITGGTGFVGREIVRKVCARCMAVRLLARSPGSASKLAALNKCVETISGDIFSQAALNEGIKGCDAVIHLVGILKETGAQTYERVHFEGARNVIDAAARAGAGHFVLMSAENTRPDAPSRYHRTKFQAEEHLKKSGLRYTIIRPSVMFGPDDRNFNELAKVIRAAPVVPVIGDGQYIWKPVWVEDVAELFVSVVMNKRAFGKTYEMRGPERFTFDEILNVMMRVMNISKPNVHIPAGLMRPFVSLMGLAPSVAPITPELMKMLVDKTGSPPENVSADFPMKLKRLEDGLREYIR